MELPTIIYDLAMLLIVASITTILFKKINQPLVLGYIIAGFITGPNFQYFPTIVDTENIATWSEIGVIFLLFALGLEFSFYKLKSVGSTAFIATSCEILGMLFLGYCAGQALGWSNMDSVFLGGMLSMSSTTIIIKAFDDLNMRSQPFTEIVFGMLIVEDIAGIVMMVMLSTIAMTAGGLFSADVLLSIGRLVFFLILWFVAGIYIIPTFFKKARKLMNDELLIVVCIGLCLSMAVLATKLGFSSALGAFIMGSLIAEAPNLHTIETLVKPVKDLFGAVFFVSVGMLVNPEVLIQHWLPIVVIIAVTVIGKLIFSTGGVLLGGQSLQTSVHAGFSLAQIGEFSFIIASLGTSLGVTGDFLYPIVVAVSVSTTFTTPYFINASDWGYNMLHKILPQQLTAFLDKHNANAKVRHNDSDWSDYLQNFLMRMLICGTLLASIFLGAKLYLLPVLSTVLYKPYHAWISGVLTLIIMSPILRTLMASAERGTTFSVLWVKHKANHIPLTFLIIMKLAVAALTIFATLTHISGFNPYIAATLTLGCIYIISKSEWLMRQYLNIESRFLINLNEKHLAEYRKQNAITTDAYLGSQLKIASCTVPEDSNLIGQTLLSSNFRSIYGCNIVQAQTDTEYINIPNANYTFSANNQLLLVGTTEQLRILKAAISSGNIGLKLIREPITLHDFAEKGDKVDENKRLYPFNILIDNTNPLLGKTLRSEKLRENYQAMAVALVRGDYTITDIRPDMEFQNGDLLWLLGQKSMLSSLVEKRLL